MYDICGEGGMDFITEMYLLCLQVLRMRKRYGFYSRNLFAAFAGLTNEKAARI